MNLNTLIHPWALWCLYFLHSRHIAAEPDTSQHELIRVELLQILRCREGEQIGMCFPPWSTEEEMWLCGGHFAGDAVGTLFKIKAQLTSMATTWFCSNTSSHLIYSYSYHCHLFFNRTMIQNMPPGYVSAMLQRSRVKDCCRIIS